MAQMTGGQAIVESLRAEGVTKVFGLIGSAGMEIFDGLYSADHISLIGVRDERTGTHMADGYARASGKAGVVLAGQNGPGATNLVTGLAQANAAFSPVVALAGSLSSAHMDRDAFQEVDQRSVFSPVTKKSWTLTQASRGPEMVRHAFRTALAPRRGPVALNLPRDMLAATIDAEIMRPERHGLSALAAASAASIDVIAGIVSSAKRPLILAGGGVKTPRNSALTLRLAEAIGAPVVLSPGHGDAIPCDHELYAGQVGRRGNAVATNLAREADVVIALGTRIGFNTTFYEQDVFAANAKLIQIDIEPGAPGRFQPITYGLSGDCGEIAAQLLQALEGRIPQIDADWLQTFRQSRRLLIEERESARDGGGLLRPDALFKSLRAALPTDTMFTMDAGTLCLQATDQMLYRQTPALLTPLDFGLVGFSHACGLGAKLAVPERTVVSLMGDGGFGMVSSELGTAISHGINTITIVMNNGCWGAEKAYQRDFFGERYIGADVVNPPYDKLAELWGAKGYRAERASEVESAISDALQCGRPAVIDVRVDPDAIVSFRRDSFAHRAGAK